MIYSPPLPQLGQNGVGKMKGKQIMANQENGKIKQMKIRVPMSLFRQLEIDAENHGEDPSTRARHILIDQLMDIDVSTPEEQAIIKQMIEDNWAKINAFKNKKAKGK